MKRELLAAAFVGLAFAGCSHSRTARPPGVEGGPVGLTPAPSIYDTINRGTSPGMAKATLPDPANPNWSGAPLIVKGAGGAGSDSTARSAAAPAPAQTRWGEPPRELAVEAAAASEGLAAAPEADPTEDPGLPPAVEADQAALGFEELPDLPAAVDAAALPAAAPARDPSPVPASTPTPAPSADLGEDPLLGPNPELMPAMEPGPKAAVSDPAADAAPAPSAGEFPLLPATQAEDEDEDDEPEAPPALEAAPAAEPAPPASAMTPASRIDAQVRTVSATSAPSGADVDDSHWKQAGLAAARVGDEVITLRELNDAVKETVRRQGGKVNELSKQELNLVARHVLAALIERTLMVQEAKHQLKNNEKQLMKIQEAADRVWHEDQLPPLLRQNFVENEHQLRRKFDQEGRSLAVLQSNFRQEFLAYAFVQQKIGDKTGVSLPEMLEYYEAHKADQDNYRSPVVVWREILIEKKNHASADEARARADALLARIRRGEDFAAVAAAESEGPARIKAAGGLMETAPGSYVVAAVNRALDSLPLNTPSDVVEGPESFHLLLVESRSSGGPATFAELQDRIRVAVREEKSERQRRDLVNSLRKKTVVTTIFDGTASDPNRIPR